MLFIRHYLYKRHLFFIRGIVLALDDLYFTSFYINLINIILDFPTKIWKANKIAILLNPKFAGKNTEYIDI